MISRVAMDCGRSALFNADCFCHVSSLMGRLEFYLNSGISPASARGRSSISSAPSPGGRHCWRDGTSEVGHRVGVRAGVAHTYLLIAPHGALCDLFGRSSDALTAAMYLAPDQRRGAGAGGSGWVAGAAYVWVVVLRRRPGGAVGSLVIPSCGPGRARWASVASRR